jgi:hypothetical protein
MSYISYIASTQFEIKYKDTPIMNLNQKKEEI